MFLFNYSGKSLMKWRTCSNKEKIWSKKLAIFRTVMAVIALQISHSFWIKLSWCRRSNSSKKRCFLLCWKKVFFRWILPHRNKIQSGSWSTSGTFDLVNSLSLSPQKVCQTIHPPQNHIDGTYTPTDQSLLACRWFCRGCWQAVPWCFALWWNGGQTE